MSTRYRDHIWRWRCQTIATASSVIPILTTNIPQDYLIGVAQKYSLYKYIRFNSSVEEAKWDDDEGKWKTTIRVLGGKEMEYQEQYTVTADFLVSAIGQLNLPKHPEIPDMRLFRGKMMHSARWDWTYDVQGKKTAIIGSGKSRILYESSCAVS